MSNQEPENEPQKIIFSKNKRSDKIYWVEWPREIGPLKFSFDKKKIYNAWVDYPHNLTPEEKEIFDRENPHWAEFFADRQIETKE